jgi:hypothetical protein
MSVAGKEFFNAEDAEGRRGGEHEKVELEIPKLLFALSIPVPPLRPSVFSAFNFWATSNRNPILKSEQKPFFFWLLTPALIQFP